MTLQFAARIPEEVSQSSLMETALWLGKALFLSLQREGKHRPSFDLKILEYAKVKLIGNSTKESIF